MMKIKLRRVMTLALVLSFVFNFTVSPAFAQGAGSTEYSLEEETNIHDITEYVSPSDFPGLDTEAGAAVSGDVILEVGADRSEMNGTGGITVGMKLSGTKNSGTNSAQIQFANSWIKLSNTMLSIPAANVEVTVDWELDQWHVYKVSRQKATNPDGSYAGYQINFYVDDVLKGYGIHTDVMAGNISWLQRLSLYSFADGDFIRSASLGSEDAKTTEAEANIHDIAEYVSLPDFPGLDTENGAAVTGNAILEMGAGRSEMNGTGGVTVDMKLGGTLEQDSAVNLQFANSFIWFNKETLHIPGTNDVGVDWKIGEWHTYKITRQRAAYSDGSYAGYQIHFYVDDALKASGFSADMMAGDISWRQTLSLYKFAEGDYIRTSGKFEVNIHDIAEYQFISGMETEEGLAVSGNPILEQGAGRSEMSGTGGIIVDMKLDGTMNSGSEINMQFANSWISLGKTRLFIPAANIEETVDWNLSEWHTYKVVRQRKTDSEGRYAGYQIDFYVDGELKGSGIHTDVMAVDGNNWLSTLSLYQFTEGDRIRSVNFQGDKAKLIEKEKNIHDIVEYQYISGMETEAGLAVSGNPILEVGKGRSEMDGTGGVTVSMKLEGTKNREKNAEHRDWTAVNIQLANSFIWFDNITLHIPGAEDVTVDWDVAEWHSYKLTRQKTTYPDGRYAGYQISFYVDDEVKSSGFSADPMAGGNSWTQTFSLYQFTEGDRIRTGGIFETEGNLHDIAEYQYISGMETKDGAAVSGIAILEAGVGQSEMEGTGGILVDLKLKGTKNRERNEEAPHDSAVNLQFADSWIWFGTEKLHIPGAEDVTVDWNVDEWHTYKITRQKETGSDGSYIGYKTNFYVDDQLKVSGFSTDAMMSDRDGNWRQALSMYNFAEGDRIRSPRLVSREIEKDPNVRDISDFAFIPGMESTDGLGMRSPGVEILNGLYGVFGKGEKSDFDVTGGVEVEMKLKGTKNRERNEEAPHDSAVNLQFASSFIWFDGTTLHIPGTENVTVDWDVAEWHNYKITRRRAVYPDGGYAGYQTDFYVDGELKATGFSTDAMTGGDDWTSQLSLYNFVEGDYIRSPRYLTLGYEAETNVRDILDYYYLLGMESDSGLNMRSYSIDEINGLYGAFNMGEKADMSGTGGLLVDMKLGSLYNRRDEGGRVSLQLANSYIWLSSEWLHLPGMFEDAAVDWDLNQWHSYKITRQKAILPGGGYAGYRISFYVDGMLKASSFTTDVMYGADEWLQKMSLYEFGEGDYIRSTLNRGWLDPETNVKDITDYADDETLLTKGYETSGTPVVNTGACEDTHSTGGVIFRVDFSDWKDDGACMWNQIGTLSIGIWNKGWVSLLINPAAFGERIESGRQIAMDFDATSSKECTIKIVRRQTKDKTGFVAALYINDMNEPVHSHYFRDMPMVKEDNWFDSIYVPAPVDGKSTFHSAYYYGVKTVVDSESTLHKVENGKSFALPVIAMSEEDGGFVSVVWRREDGNLFANSGSVSSYGTYKALGVRMWNEEKAESYQDEAGNHLRWTSHIDTDSKVALIKQLGDLPVSYGVEITRLSDNKTVTHKLDQVNSNGVEEWFHFDMIVDESDENTQFAYRSYIQVGEKRIYTGYAVDRENTVSLASVNGTGEVPGEDPGTDTPKPGTNEPVIEETGFNVVPVVIVVLAVLALAAIGILLVLLKKRGRKKDE